VADEELVCAPQPAAVIEEPVADAVPDVCVPDPVIVAGASSLEESEPHPVDASHPTEAPSPLGVWLEPAVPGAGSMDSPWEASHTWEAPASADAPVGPASADDTASPWPADASLSPDVVTASWQHDPSSDRDVGDVCAGIDVGTGIDAWAGINVDADADAEITVMPAARPARQRRSRKRKITEIPADEQTTSAVVAWPAQDDTAAFQAEPIASPRTSLMDRHVPAWEPPTNLEAIAAEARQKKAAPAPRPEVPDAPVMDPLPAPVVSAPVVPAPVASDPEALAPPVWTPDPPIVAPACQAPPSVLVTSVADPVDAAPPPRALAPPRRRTLVTFSQQINWRRTIAASIIFALLEGAAFAAAWWWVHPGARGTLVVQTSQPGVAVLIDGTQVGETPYRSDLKPGRHRLTLRQGSLVREMPVEITLGVVTTQTLDWPDGPEARHGTLTVTSAPTNAEVVIDGTVRGRTPLTLGDLTEGKHKLTIRSASGTVSVTADVRAGETSALDVPIFAGWILVHAPLDLAVRVDGTHVGSSLDGQILLAPGTYRITASNQRLGFSKTVSATVEPGKIQRVTIEVPDVVVRGEGEQGTEVWVGGELRGTLPARVTVPLGTHEVVLRRPDGSERRRTMTARADTPLHLD
jgi:hypothetical protein